MNNLNIIYILAFCIGATQVSAEGKMDPLVKLTVKVLDESGNAVANAVVNAGGTAAFAKVADSWGSGNSDIRGLCKLEFRALADAHFSAHKDGNYYPSSLRGEGSIKFIPFIYRDDIPESEQVDPPLKTEVKLEGAITLRATKKPIPLCAQNLRIDFPARDVWLGYDLEMSDWVPPYGKGKREDIRFRSQPKVEVEGIHLEESPGNAVLEVSFGDGGGLFRVNDQNGYLAVSEMTMPHDAPIDGYSQLPALKREQKGYEYSDPEGTRGYFFRTRVVRDGDRIVSANYGKIPTEIGYMPVQRLGAWFGDKKLNRPSFGGVEFTYYFNPVPSDRNLEFDPKRNLIPRGNVERP